MIDLEEAALRTTVVPPEKVASLLAALKKVPEFGWLLTSPNNGEERLQGDVHADFQIYEQSLANKARLASFSQNGFYYLLIKITSHLARAESAEVQRSELN